MSQDKLLKDQLRTMISKARRSLAAAKRQIEDGDYDFASSRAYYAAFYAIEASERFTKEERNGNR